MSDRLRIVLAGSSGLIGSAILISAAGKATLCVAPLARAIAPVDQWQNIIAQARPDVFVSALGTTWKSAGRDEAAFRAVDQHLVLRSADAARAAGARHCITVSSVGAAVSASGFYLRVKGEVEDQLSTIGFDRLDILRPGLLRGSRQGAFRAAEQLAIAISPLTDALMFGGLRRYRSILAADVARACLQLAIEGGSGKHIHEHDRLIAASRRFGD